MLIKYLNMIRNKQYDALRTEISSMPPCQTQWLNPNFKLEYAMDSDDSSCSGDDEDEEMDVCTNDTTDVQNTSKTKGPITDEDGWTTVSSKRK